MRFLALSFILLCAPGGLLDFAMNEWKKDEQAVEMQDAYKWLYQATLGGEHAVPDEEMAREWLDREWLTLGAAQKDGAAKDEPLWQPLCKNGSIGRLNLRPFRDRQGSAAGLLSAFVRSSKGLSQNKENFLQAWYELGKKIRKKPWGKLDLLDWHKLDGEMRSKNYPAVHHSKNYNEARKPAYRVLTGEEAKKLEKTLTEVKIR